MSFTILSEQNAKTIVNAIEDATGDVIKEDLSRSNLSYFNSTPQRVWDHIYTIVTRRIQRQGFQVISTNSGPWRFPIIYDHTSGNIITIMREKRFADLKKQKGKRTKHHYVDILTAAFNKDLLAKQEQLSVLEKSRPELDEIKRRVDIMFHDFNGDTDLVRNHVLILFEASDYTLFSARAIMVTPELETAVNAEDNLSELIEAKPSIIPDKVDNPDSAVNNPSLGLRLKAKAIERQQHYSRIHDESVRTENDK